jgi:prepilin-type N-terminal cleavage/methylation domain-containing protein
MRISRTGRSRRTETGFTLLELTVVVALLATLYLVALPRFHHLLSPDVDRDVRREMENVLLAVRQEAILGRAPLAIFYDLEQGIYRSARLSEDGQAEIEDDPLSLKRRLPEGMKFLDIVTSREGKITRGSGFTTVWPSGWIEPTTLHLRDGEGQAFTLLLQPIAGTVRLEEGYTERRKVAY